jgi:hypothetical protein
MNIYLRFRVEIRPEVRRDLESAPQILIEELHQALSESLLLIESSVKEQITSIHLIDTGRLRSSIHSDVVSVTLRSFRGEVAAKSDVKYAAIHEFGGILVSTTVHNLPRASSIRGAELKLIPTSARIFAWTDKGVTRPGPGDKEGWKILRKSGQAHFARAVIIPARYYMRDGVDKVKGKVRLRILRGILAAWARVLHDRGDL